MKKGIQLVKYGHQQYNKCISLYSFKCLQSITTCILALFSFRPDDGLSVETGILFLNFQKKGSLVKKTFYLISLYARIEN